MEYISESEAVILTLNNVKGKNPENVGFEGAIIVWILRRPHCGLLRMVPSPAYAALSVIPERESASLIKLCHPDRSGPHFSPQSRVICGCNVELTRYGQVP